MKKKSIIVCSIIAIHIITNFIIQYKMFAYIIAGKAFVETHILIGISIWIGLLCIDFFVCRLLLRKSRLEIKHKVLLHCVDLLLIIPVAILLIILLYPIAGVVQTYELFEIILTIEIVVTDVLLIAERIVQTILTPLSI